MERGRSTSASCLWGHYSTARRGKQPRLDPCRPWFWAPNVESLLGETAREEARMAARLSPSRTAMIQDQKPQQQRNRLGVGLALAVLAGVVFGHAITSHETAGWWTGLVTLLCGALLILSTVYARRGRSHTITQPLG